MRCEICNHPLKQGGEHRAKCLHCGAEYEIQESRSRPTYVLIEGTADPEIENISSLAKRLRICADQTIKDPKGALELLEDIWVEFSTVVDNGHYKIVDETVRLREENARLRVELSHHERIFNLEAIRAKGPPISQGEENLRHLQAIRTLPLDDLPSDPASTPGGHSFVGRVCVVCGHAITDDPERCHPCEI